MSEQQEQTPPGASALLAAARERLGYSQKEVADKLYLTTTFIQYIDAGEFEKIPKQAFVKGYLRSYARTVNLSGDEIVSLYEAELEAHAPEPEIKGVTEENVSSSAITGPVLQTGLIGLGGLILVVALVWWLVSEPEAPPVRVSQPTIQAPERPETIPQDFNFVLPDSEDAASTDAITEAVTEEGEESPSEPAGFAAAPSAGDEAADAEELVESEIAAPEPEAESQPEAPQDAISGEALEEVRFERTSDGDRSFVTVDAGGFDQIELSFEDECWVEVEDNSRGMIYNDLNSTGDVLTIYGTAPFEILLGKATGVQMIYNGRPFDVGPYISQDKTAKLTVSE